MLSKNQKKKKKEACVEYTLAKFKQEQRRDKKKLQPKKIKKAHGCRLAYCLK